jgi:DNA-binding Lrp family transcriptional regulator
MHFRGLVPMALRIRCRPNRIRQVANALARRGDTIWVDVLGGGDEISAVFFLDGPDARNALLLRDLPATDAVRSWTAHTMLRVFPAAFRWTGGLLSAEEIARLTPSQPPVSMRPPAPLDIDEAVVEALVEDARVSYTDLARRAGVTAVTARRRLDLLVQGWVVRLATEVDLRLLGAQAEALLWITVQPGALEETAERLTTHPQVWFVAATVGPTNLLVALAVTDQDAVYRFLVDTVGPLRGITAIETTLLLATAKRTGLARRSSRLLD